MKAYPAAMDIDDRLSDLVVRLASGECLYVDRLTSELVIMFNPWTLAHGERVIIVPTGKWGLRAVPIREYAEMCARGERVSGAVGAALREIDPTLVCMPYANCTPAAQWYDSYFIRRT
jgi:hypothetical protein